ncbi:3318_t:CDS:1 [Funneliformis geosporum]|uniref:20053_t:CDS:1 n=1 Tax=Funneliformis geosporum TaxID=1117311 RepID=A0A9W4SAH9_9GLOM|nr:20053_t:CDS:1 [Funneliformis geosporum]CAI2162011.1 3318_t:CDS:1 [Funneliformis geosporum]
MSSCSSKCFQTTKKTPLILLPYPPTIKASDIVNKRKPSKVTSKSPNAFLIYRKAFLEQLSILKHNLRMTDVSKLVSGYWKNEPKYVKDAYRKIAQDVEIELSELRKQTVSYRIIWKNSKYSTVRKRGKTAKSQESKPEAINSKKPTQNCGNVFYQFVPTSFPNVEFTSKPPKKQAKEVIAPPSPPSDLNDLPEKPQQELEFNEPFNEYINYPECTECNEYANNNNLESNLQLIDNNTKQYSQPIEQEYFIFEKLDFDWYLQNIYPN